MKIDTELFPYKDFPIRLQFGEKKQTTICYFECEAHLQKYLERYKIDTKTLKLDYRDGKPLESDKANKNSLQQRNRKTSDRSANRNKRSTKNLDAN